jgi:hypothetical protein
MACRYTYKGKTYKAFEFDEVLKAMPPVEAAKYMPGIQAIPSAPFIDKTPAWTALALKRMIRYAAENGFDRVAFTTGEQQAARYDLSKQIDRVEISRPQNGSFAYYAYKQKSDTVPAVQGRAENEQELADVLGKDFAKKASEQPIGTKRDYSGLDLKVGGEGMKAFYDRIVPNVANDVLKKLGGGKVGAVRVDRTDYGKRGKPADWKAEYASFGEQPGFDITPAMRDKAMEGLPLFARNRNQARSIELADAKAAVDVITSKWKNAPKINVWDSIEKAPDALRDEIDRSGAYDARGAWYEGEIHLFTPNIPNLETLERVVVHEARHAGLEGVFGRELNSVMMSLYLNNASLRDQVNKLRKDTKLSVVVQVNEVLADMPLDAAQKLSGWKKLVGAMKAWLEKNGFTRLAAMLDGPNADDIVKDVLYQAEEFIRSGRKATTLTGGAMFSMGETKQTDTPAFRPDQIKSAIGNRGTFDPDNPNILFSRGGNKESQRAAQAAAEYGVSKAARAVVGKKMLGEVLKNPNKFNAINRTLNTQLHKALKNEQFGKVFWATQMFIEDVSQFAAQAAELSPDLLPNYADIRNIKQVIRDSVSPVKARKREADIKAASAAIFDGTMLGGGNPLDGKVFTEAELKERGLTENGIRFYRDARKIIDKSLDDLAMSEVVRLIGERVELAPEALEILKAGSTQFRNGLLEAIETAKDNSEGKRREALQDIEDRARETFKHVEALKDAGYAPLMRFGKYFITATDKTTGETVYRAHYENRVDLNLALSDARAKFKDADVTTGVVSDEDFKLMRGMTPETIMLFADKIGLPMDMRDAAQTYYQMAVSQRSAMKRRIERQGTSGFSDDLTRVLAGFATSNARRAATNYNLGKIMRAVEEIDKADGDVRDEALKMIEQVENPTEDAAALRGAMYAYFIGGSIASALVNLTQVPMMTLPYLSQYGSAKAGSAIMAAMRPNSKLSKTLRDALHVADEKGITDPQEVYFLYQETIRGISSNKNFQKAMGLWGSMFSVAENINRRTTFLSAFEMWTQADAEMQKKMRDDTGATDAFAFARRVVQETQGIYNKGNRPNWGRGAIGATALTFKQYSIAYLELLSRLPAQQKMLMLAMLFLVAGAGGLPFEEDAEDIIDTIGQAMGYNTNSKMFINEKVNDLLGETFGGLFMRGISAHGPFDIAGRMGMGNLLPSTSLFQRSESNSKVQQFAEVLGPIGSMVGNVMNAQTALQAGDVPAAVANAAPVAIGNMMKGIKWAQDGKATDYKDRMTVDDITFTDGFFKAIGFNPRRVADEGRVARMVGQDVRMLRDVESDIVAKMAEAIAKGNEKKFQDALSEYEDWNEKNPNTPIKITRAQVERRVKEMNTERSVRQLKTIPKEARGAYAEMLRP